jgi:YfiH family protein
MSDRVPLGVRGGFHAWEASYGDVRACFAGRQLAGEALGREAAFEALAPSGKEVAWLRQVHSATVVDAAAGECGEGDALVAPAGDLALAVVTADCVPVLLAGGGRVAAVHAGWRGVAGRIVPATLERMDAAVAWIGPAIGPCCYEVGDDVAARVTAVSGDEVARPGPRGRPHLDLRRAVEIQVRASGVGEVHQIGPCTRCAGDVLRSYRRDGRGAGRNVSLIG